MLQEDCNIKLKKIARENRAVIVTVHYRVNRLIEEGVITDSQQTVDLSSGKEYWRYRWSQAGTGPDYSKKIGEKIAKFQRLGCLLPLGNIDFASFWSVVERGTQGNVDAFIKLRKLREAIPTHP